jgi:hypothetical protein
MKTLKIILLAGCICFAFTSPKRKQVEYCKLKGSFFVTENRSIANFLVYVQPEEGFQDFYVFKESNSLYSIEPGHWHMVEDARFADYIIYYTEDRAYSDFSVYYTDIETIAGCGN